MKIGDRLVHLLESLLMHLNLEAFSSLKELKRLRVDNFH